MGFMRGEETKKLIRRKRVDMCVEEKKQDGKMKNEKKEDKDYSRKWKVGLKKRKKKIIKKKQEILYHNIFIKKFK